MKKYIDRRKFLTDTSFVVAGIAIGGALIGCSDKGVTASPDEPVPGLPDFDVKEQSISAIRDAYIKGLLTAEQLVQLYLDRIAKIDQNKGGLNAVLELNPDALEIARQLDAEWKKGMSRGPLHGIPVLIKGNIATADKMQTTAGAVALEGCHASEDAFLVTRLRKSGAIILGKTNLSEWANFTSWPSSSGWSGLGGQTRNPYDKEYCPCGSSAGSGVAAAASLATVTIGTETDGSIICPSAFNGLVGIKPTVNLVSRRGIIPISHTQDTAGPMARTVEDAAMLLGAIAAPDPQDVIIHKPEVVTKEPLVYTKFLDKAALNGARIGWLNNMPGWEGDLPKPFRDALDILTKRDAELIELSTLFPKMEEYGDAEFKVLLYEFKAGVNKYLKSALQGKNRILSLEEVIAFNKANADRALSGFGQNLLEMANEKGDLEEKEYLDALALHKAAGEAFDNTLKEHKLDAIVACSNGSAWKIDHEKGDQFTGGTTTLSAVSGYPNITVPAGMMDGFPIGISFMASAFEEGKLIRFAYAYEQASKARISPDID